MMFKLPDVGYELMHICCISQGSIKYMPQERLIILVLFCSNCIEIYACVRNYFDVKKV